MTQRYFLSIKSKRTSNFIIKNVKQFRTGQQSAGPKFADGVRIAEYKAHREVRGFQKVNESHDQEALLVQKENEESVVL